MFGRFAARRVRVPQASIALSPLVLSKTGIKLWFKCDGNTLHATNECTVVANLTSMWVSPHKDLPPPKSLNQTTNDYSDIAVGTSRVCTRYAVNTLSPLQALALALASTRDLLAPPHFESVRI